MVRGVFRVLSLDWSTETRVGISSIVSLIVSSLFNV